MNHDDVPTYLEDLRVQLLPIIGAMVPRKDVSMEEFHHMLGYHHRALQTLIIDLERRENELRHADTRVTPGTQ